MKIIILKFILIFFLLINLLHAKSDYFNEGVNLYKKEKFEEAQFKFEQEKLYDTQIDRPSDETLDLLSSDRFPSTLRDIKRMEHELIIKIMRQTGGKVSGPGGAAGILKVKPTTLYSKLKNIPDLDDKLKG